MIEFIPRRTADAAQLGEYATDVDNLRIRAALVVTGQLAWHLPSRFPDRSLPTDSSSYVRISMGLAKSPELRGNISEIWHPSLSHEWVDGQSLGAISDLVAEGLRRVTENNSFIRGVLVPPPSSDVLDSCKEAIGSEQLNGDPRALARVITDAGNRILGSFALANNTHGYDPYLISSPDLLWVDDAK